MEDYRTIIKCVHTAYREKNILKCVFDVLKEKQKKQGWNDKSEIYNKLSVDFPWTPLDNNVVIGSRSV